MIEFLLLQAMDGHQIHVNKNTIVTISEPRKIGRMGTDKFNCVIGLTSGKYVTVVETCESVRKRLKEE
jgi:uncharacterized protein YlzI (FlbEa/FlbD family)